MGSQVEEFRAFLEAVGGLRHHAALGGEAGIAAILPAQFIFRRTGGLDEIEARRAAGSRHEEQGEQGEMSGQTHAAIIPSWPSAMCEDSVTSLLGVEH